MNSLKTRVWLRTILSGALSPANDGKIEFEFTVPDNAEVFRIEAH